MDTKPLIVVSLCAVVVLLVLASLSNVAGYQSVKSTVNNSPLFQTRTLRATNQQQNLITSYYLGMEKEVHIQIPLRNSSDTFLQMILDIINKIDEKTFECYLEQYVQTIKENNSLRGTPLFEVFHIFHQLRKTPDLALHAILPEKAFQTRVLILPTSGEITACGHWTPGCVLKAVLTWIINYLLYIFQRPTIALLCWHSGGQVPC